MQKTISVFFSGTGFRIDDPHTFLAAHLFHQTNIAQGFKQESNGHINMGFHGCGVEYGLRGALFGHGIDEQCEHAIQRILQEIEKGNRIVLNVYGHSRGAIQALMLAKQLGNIDPKFLSINMALLDPVPGNSITSSTLDSFQLSLANKTMDLTSCRPLKKVLALYPYEPLPAIIFHAPLFASYPEGIELEEDMISGCHAEAEQLENHASLITKIRIEEFLAKNGTKFPDLEAWTDESRINRMYLEQYQLELMRLKHSDPTYREGHSERGIYIHVDTEAQYFNAHHKRLAEGAEDATIALRFEYSNSPISLFQRLKKAYPLATEITWQILKWTAISVSLACLLYFTGGLAAIPLGSGLTVSLGIGSIFAITPIIAGIAAATWYGLIKPIFMWTSNRLLYPNYSVREVASDIPQTTNTSTGQLLNTLGQEKTMNPSDALQIKAPYQGKKLFEQAPVVGDAPLDAPLQLSSVRT